MMPHYEKRTEFSADAARSLEADLRGRIAGEVRFDRGSRALYATDASNYRQVPIGVVIPRTIDDIVETTALCRRNQAPLLARGGGHSLAGQCSNVAVVLDLSKYLNSELDIDAEVHRARVDGSEEGVVGRECVSSGEMRGGG